MLLASSFPRSAQSRMVRGDPFISLSSSTFAPNIINILLAKATSTQRSGSDAFVEALLIALL